MQGGLDPLESSIFHIILYRSKSNVQDEESKPRVMHGVTKKQINE